MAKGTRMCRVCGKEYEYCHTLRRNPNVYRWQDVACCEEHGREYLAKIIASRNEEKATEVREEVPEAIQHEEIPAEVVVEEATQAKKYTKSRKNQDS